ESCELVFVAAHQVQHVLGSAHWSLDVAQWVAAPDAFYALDGQQHFIASRCNTLTYGGRLRGNVLRAARHDATLVFRGVLTNARCYRDGFITNELQGAVDLQLLDVLRQVTGGHALVNVLMTSQRVEFFDASFHVMARHALTIRDGT